MIAVLYQGELAAQDEVSAIALDYGAIERSLWEVPLPPCPDCGAAKLVWYEAGYVPGTRKCTACRSLFHIEAKEGRALLTRSELHI